MKIQINPDQTVSILKSRKSSFVEMMAGGLLEQVNVLDEYELVAIIWSVKACPFPLYSDNAERVYKYCLENARGNDDLKEVIKISNISLGEFRKNILIRASQGCNAPHDHYLKVAWQIKTGNPVNL